MANSSFYSMARSAGKEHRGRVRLRTHFPDKGEIVGMATKPKGPVSIASQEAGDKRETLILPGKGKGKKKMIIDLPRGSVVGLKDFLEEAASREE